MTEMCEEMEGTMPTIDQWLTMRSDVDGYYTVFFKRFILAVVGLAAYRSQVGVKFLRHFVTVCDEAFVLLMLENNEARWMDMYSRDATKSTLVNKFTDGGTSQKNGRSRSFSGWSNAGLNRFNELFKMVERDRARENCGFEGAFLNQMREKYGNKRKRNIGRAVLQEEEPVTFVLDEMDMVQV